MLFIESLKNVSTQIHNVYDLIAVLYECLDKHVDDWEIFQASYLEFNPECENNNPNLPILKTIPDVFKAYLLDENILVEDFSVKLEWISNQYIEFCNRLENYENKIDCEMTVLYFVLVSLDYYCGKIPCPSGAQPLNNEYNKHSYVYRLQHGTLLDEAITDLYFGEQTKSMNINDQFYNILIVPRLYYKKTQEATTVYPLFTKYTAKTKMIKVAVVPFNGFRMTEIERTAGNLYGIVYSDEYNEKYAKRAIAFLKKAIDCDANIILFPEYICSRYIQNGISKYLEQEYYSGNPKLDSLWFVVAGSCWEDNNNIARVYDNEGILIGEHYKFTKFHDKNHTENLVNPGKKSTILYVPQVGTFMPLICRDVADGEDIHFLIKQFEPFMVMVPAWSKSVDRAFRTNFKHIIHQTYGTVLLCNSCEPLLMKDKRKKECNTIGTPYKKDSYVEGFIQYMKMDHGCYSSCQDKGCLFMIDLNYNTNNVKNKNIVENIEHIYIEM